MCISWRRSCSCTLPLSCRWGTGKIFGEWCSQGKNGCWENAFCKGYKNTIVLLVLSKLELSLFASDHLCKVNFAGSKWFLVACRCQSSRGNFQNFWNRFWVRVGWQGTWASLGHFTGGLWKLTFFFSSLLKVGPLKGVLTRMIKTLRCHG